MEMRAIEDTAIGQDLSPPLRPLAVVLRDSALSSHCSACFSTLPPQPFSTFAPPFSENTNHVPSDTPTLPLYCSPDCSSYDSPLHLASGEAHLLRSPPSTWSDSSDLRLSLRLVSIFQKLPQRYNYFPRLSINSDQKVFLGRKKDNPLQKNGDFEDPDDYLENNEETWEDTERSCHNDVVFERIAGLMTNREKLVLGGSTDKQFQGSDEDDNLDENNENILERIKKGAKLIASVDENVNVDKHEEFVLEEMILCLVLTNAVEVQDKSGCSIGIAVYDTAFSWINHSCSPNACYRFLVGLEDNEQSSLRITSAAKSGYVNDLMVEEKNGYGPRVIVRSIKDVRKGEEVTIAYMDLLQPKETRQAELWFKYRFNCRCKRCDAVPATYVDNALQALSANNPDTSPESLDNKVDKLMQSFDDAITDYLSSDDPISCCKNLENLLIRGHLLEPNEANSSQNPKLHIFHHLSLNAYTTLASAYKVLANDLLALNDDVERQNLEAFNMYKTSAAYSLLLAGGAHHLFTFESALIATAANLWINAGESLLDFARSSLWGSFRLDFSSVLTQDCDNCCLTDILEAKYVSPDRNMEFEEIKNRLYNCIADITPKVWSMVASESGFLKVVRNPVDFSWLAFPETYMILETSRSDVKEFNDQVRMNLILLSDHCLRYGALLSSICYGFSADMNYYYRTHAFLKESA